MLGWLQKFVVTVAVLARISVVPAACTYLVISYGHPGSEKPVPSDGSEETSKPQTQATHAQREAASDQRDTLPPPIAVQILTPVEANTHAKNDEENQFKKALNDWGIPIFTGISTAIFLAQLIVFGLQARRLKETVEAMKKIDKGQSAKVTESIAESKRAADAMADVAKAMKDSAHAAQSAADVARMQFVAANRPYLDIRGISIFRQTGPGDIVADLFEANSPIIGSLVMVNHGETDAKIIASAYRFYWTQRGLPMEPPFVENGTEKIQRLFDGDNLTLGGKEARQIQIRSVDRLDADTAYHIPRSPNLRQLYLMGVIRYTDAGIPPRERLRGFCRLYVPEGDPTRDGFFQIVINPNYEFDG